jgi:Fe2+ or Zn2+ uptake regulation protein
MKTQLTENQEKVLNLMKEKYPNGAFADEIAEGEGLVVASVRATLTSLATKGLLDKTKDIYEGKEKTKYIVK